MYIYHFLSILLLSISLSSAFLLPIQPLRAVPRRYHRHALHLTPPSAPPPATTYSGLIHHTHDTCICVISSSSSSRPSISMRYLERLTRKKHDGGSLPSFLIPEGGEMASGNHHYPMSRVLNRVPLRFNNAHSTTTSRPYFPLPR